MPDIVVGTARAGVARLVVSLAKRCRFALPGAYLATVLGVCNPPVVYGAEAEEPVVEVVVTGTRLGSANTSSPSPIVVLDNEELLHQGTPRAEDLLNSLPQVNSGLTLGANGASVAPLTGTATADLRGIGAFRTLVLINGRRTAPGDPINPSADLNTVPSTLVKRVEVLTGGASAIYGSDAVSGVVNFILDTNFTGFKLDVEGAINRGSNDRTDLQAIERASGVMPRTGTVYDGGTQDVSAVFGKDLLGGRAHVTAYAGFRHTHAVAGASRDFSGCTLTETGPSFQCLLDGTTAAGQFVPPNGGSPLTLDTVNGHAFRPLVPPADLFNPAPYQTLQRPDERYTAGLFGNYKFNDAATLYTEAQFMYDRTDVLYEPTGTTSTNSALSVFGINCNNPLLSASEVNDLCTSNGLLPTDTAQVGLGRRNVEGGQRTDEFRHESYRVVLGVRGGISEPWSYDASVTYGRVNGRETLSNDFSVSNLTNALNVVNVNGVPTCQSVVNGTDPACVPYNIFAVGGVTPAALTYITEGGQQSGYAQRTIATGLLTGDLTHYGIVSPLAHTGVSMAAGAEYRKESVQYNPSSSYATGDLLVTGAAHPTIGSFHVTEIFTELKVPLIEDRPFAKQVTLNASDRYAHYSPQGNVNAFGLGLEWAPVAPVRLRGSVNRAVRAPNAYELFTSQVLGQTGLIDPCAGVPTASAAQCALTGVTAAQYGNIAAQSAVNVLTGGNPRLRPETANTYTAGIVLTPRSNILFSADYWRIKVEQFVGNVPASYSLATCLNTGNPFYCSLIQRDANGSLSTGNGVSSGRILSTRFNTGSYGTSGVDFEGRYVMSLQSLAPKAGSLAFSFTGSLALDNPIDVTPGVPEIDCTDLYGPTCSGAGPTSPVPRWRHRLRMTWETHKGFDLSLNWRHIGKLNSEFTSSNPNLNNPANVFPVDSHISAYDYLDMDGSIDVTEHVNVRLGVNNLTDRKPPVIGFVANPLLVNGNLAAGMYDFLGRYLFVGLTARF
ncbi:MAG TPA: TonB-dependent receptor [Steroidobacteraceae bacterium]|nr:TonB-dependent receptor [Steroidobacteraceae bacterium]